MQVWNVLHAARWKCRTQKLCKNSPSAHYRITLSGYIFAMQACVENRKNLLTSIISSTCTHNTMNVGPLTAEVGCRVCAPQQISTAFASFFAIWSTAFNRGRHVHSAGRPSGWASANRQTEADSSILALAATWRVISVRKFIDYGSKFIYLLLKSYKK